jgi:hypothetical protein
MVSPDMVVEGSETRFVFAVMFSCPTPSSAGSAVQNALSHQLRQLISTIGEIMASLDKLTAPSATTTTCQKTNVDRRPRLVVAHLPGEHCEIRM